MSGKGMGKGMGKSRWYSASAVSMEPTIKGSWYGRGSVRKRHRDNLATSLPSLIVNLKQGPISYL